MKRRDLLLGIAAVPIAGTANALSWSDIKEAITGHTTCLLYTSPSPRDRQKSRMPSSA